VPLRHKTRHLSSSASSLCGINLSYTFNLFEKSDKYHFIFYIARLIIENIQSL